MNEKAARTLGVLPKELWIDVGQPMLLASKEGFAEEKAIEMIRNNKITERELAFLVIVACNSLFGADMLG